VFTPDMLTIRVERVTLERELRTAIEDGGSSCTTSR